MKKIILAAATALAATLGGCGTTSTTLTADISSIEAQVQADSNVLCGFIPTAATIAAFIPGFGVIAASAATIAEGVCSAIAAAPVVQPQSARMRASLALSGADTQVTVARTPGGAVPIIGHFTR